MKTRTNIPSTNDSASGRNTHGPDESTRTAARRSRRTLFVPAVALAIAVSMLATGSAWAKAHEPCFSSGTMFSDGGTSCQNGLQFRCFNGVWEALGIGCGEELALPVPSRTCDFAGISFSTGSASCQEGMQYRCEDGAWRNTGTACAMPQIPVRIVPSGGTCRYQTLTVNTGSTVCQSGSTFLCNDGAWVDLGTLCR